MQVKKEEIRGRILEAARGEFVARSFTGANMRAIATRAGTSLSNVYNYFESKDELFRAVVGPTVDGLRAVVIRETSPLLQDLDEHGFKRFERQKEMMKIIVAYVDEHREDLKLVFFKSEGSSLSGFHDELIEEHTRGHARCFQMLGKRDSGAERAACVSRFFIHNTSGFFVNAFVEMLMHDVPLKDMEMYADELVRFSYPGMRAVVGLENGG
ncbi:TetR/AcrR family transcriptional regulator [bacterium]|nr:TetR/AcrR family transcriptional regulator [bacterium]